MRVVRAWWPRGWTGLRKAGTHLVRRKLRELAPAGRHVRDAIRRTRADHHRAVRRPFEPAAARKGGRRRHRLRRFARQGFVGRIFGAREGPKCGSRGPRTPSFSPSRPGDVLVPRADQQSPPRRNSESHDPRVNAVATPLTRGARARVARSHPPQLTSLAAPPPPSPRSGGRSGALRATMDLDVYTSNRTSRRSIAPEWTSEAGASRRGAASRKWELWRRFPHIASGELRLVPLHRA